MTEGDTENGTVALHAPIALSGADGATKAVWGMAVGGLVGAAIAGRSEDVALPAGARFAARVIGSEPLPAAAPTSVFVRVPEVNSPVIGTPESGKGQVIVFRPRKFAGGAASYLIRENDTDLGAVDNGTYLVFSVEPGRHRYEAGKKRDAVTLEVAAGEVYYLMGSMIPTGFNPLANIMPVTAETFQAAKAELQPGQIPADWQ